MVDSYLILVTAVVASVAKRRLRNSQTCIPDRIQRAISSIAVTQMILVSVHKQQLKKNRKVVINVKSSYKVTPKYRGRIKARSLTEVIHSVVNWPYKLIWSNSERTTTCPQIKHVRVTVVNRQHVYGDNTKKHLQDSTSALFTKVWLRAFTQWRVTYILHWTSTRASTISC